MRVVRAYARHSGAANGPASGCIRSHTYKTPEQREGVGAGILRNPRGCRGAIGVSLFCWSFYLGVSRCSGVRRSVKTFNSLPFGSISFQFLSSTRRWGEGMQGLRLRGNTSGRNLFRVDEANARGSRLRGGRRRGGEHWPDLALFTPSREVENEAGVASFGTPSTRTRWAGWPWLWPWLASSGVARSGETFNSVAFGCISSHFPNPHPNPLPEGEGICRPWRDEVYGHCSNQRGYGVSGSCRWFGDGATSRTLNSYGRTPANQLRGV